MITIAITLGLYCLMLIFILGILKAGREEQEIQNREEEEYLR